jgi:hypothetical protein
MSRTRILVGTALLVFCGSRVVKARPDAIPVRVEGHVAEAPEEIWITPMVSPRFSVRIDKGPVSEHDLLLCKSVQTVRKKLDEAGKLLYAYKAIELHCDDNRVLSITGINLNTE